MTPSPVVILLAAGRGERFLASGGATHKLDAPLNGRPVLAHTLAAVEAAGLPWQLVRPDGGTDGMGESIALGVRATADAPGWLILPGDLPLVQPDSLRRVAQALTENNIVVPLFRQQAGHPVGFGRAWRSHLLELRGDTGARTIVQSARAEGRVTTLPLEDRGIVQDIDWLWDLERIQQLLKAEVG